MISFPSSSAFLLSVLTPATSVLMMVKSLLPSFDFLPLAVLVHRLAALPPVRHVLGVWLGTSQDEVEHGTHDQCKADRVDLLLTLQFDSNESPWFTLCVCFRVCTYVLYVCQIGNSSIRVLTKQSVRVLIKNALILSGISGRGDFEIETLVSPVMTFKSISGVLE